MSGDTEISLGPVKLKGKDAFSYSGWFVAVGVMAYATWGLPNSIREQVISQGTNIQAITTDLAVVKADVANMKISLNTIVAINRRDRNLEYSMNQGLDKTAQVR